MAHMITWTFLKTHWKKLAIIALVGAIFAIGRVSVADKPARVVEKDKIVEKEVEKIVFKDRLVEKVETKKSMDLDKREITKKETTEVVLPDGTKTTTTVETSDTGTQIKEAEIKYVDRVVERVVTVDKVVDRIVEKEKIVEAPKKDWLISGVAGVDLTQIKIVDTNLQFPVELGVQVQRRIAGPVWVGLQGTSTVSKAPQITVKLTVGFEF